MQSPAASACWEPGEARGRGCAHIPSPSRRLERIRTPGARIGQQESGSIVVKLHRAPLSVALPGHGSTQVGASLSTNLARQGPLSPQAPGARTRLPFWLRSHTRKKEQDREAVWCPGIQVGWGLNPSPAWTSTPGGLWKALAAPARGWMPGVPSREAEERWAQRTPVWASTLLPGRVSGPRGHQAGPPASLKEAQGECAPSTDLGRFLTAPSPPPG